MKYLNILWLTVFIVGCKKECEVNARFKKEFETNLTFLIRTESDTSFSHSTVDKYKSIVFLETITGTESSLIKDHVFIYRSKEDLENDLKIWREWYENNKCFYNDKKLDSIKIEIDKSLLN